MGIHPLRDLADMWPNQGVIAFDPMSGAEVLSKLRVRLMCSVQDDIWPYLICGSKARHKKRDFIVYLIRFFGQSVL